MRNSQTRSWICLANWALVSLFCWWAIGLGPAPLGAQEIDETLIEAETVEKQQAESPVTEATEPPTLFDRVDEFFGRFLVQPLAAVLFFDFWSEKWLGTSVPFVVFWLLLGATFFTFRMGFINVRALYHAIELIRGDFDKPGESGEVSHFQALTSALSATIGLGNIAGVAIAIGTGGPGATVWMILVGFLGMTSKFTECSLGMIYRKVSPDGVVSGGPMHYLRDGLADLGMAPLGRVLSVVFAVLCVGASFGGGNAFQVGQSLDAIRVDVAIFDTTPWIYGLLMAVLAGLVIIGGIKSIGRVASKIVPLMCGAYLLMTMYILFSNFGLIGSAFRQILAGAFTLEAGVGGFLGVMVTGIQRAVFSNEAGIGSAAIAHAAATTDEPVSEGIVALLGPFIDTVVICTMTAVVIIITGAAETNQELVSGAQKSGAALTAAAVSGDFGVSWFRYVLYVAVVLFAFSTLVSWSYYGERCWTNLFGDQSSLYYKCLFLVFTVLGSIVTTGNILDFSDLLILGMAVPNILGVLLLSGVARRKLDEYWAKYRSGELKPTSVTRNASN